MAKINKQQLRPALIMNTKTGPYYKHYDLLETCRLKSRGAWIPEAELWLLEDEESLPSLEESELLSLLSESDSEESDSEEDAEDEEVRGGFFCSPSGFCATITLGVFFRCSRSSSLTEIQCIVTLWL